MYVPDESTTEPKDDDRSHSGIFRRTMARDMYELTKRVSVLEQDSGNPFSGFSTAWPYIAIGLIFFVSFAASSLYFDYRVDKVEKLQRADTLALRSQLESEQQMIYELQQVVHQQARSQQTPASSSPMPGDEIAITAVPAQETNTVPKSVPPSQQPSRTPLPSFLEAGEVLLIVASTSSKEQALDLAQEFERDGHASEVVLGKTGYYGVALGRFEFNLAKSTKSFLVETGAVNSTPYLMTDSLIDSYVYP